jgi:hypothetical protein
VGRFFLFLKPDSNKYASFKLYINRIGK